MGFHQVAQADFKLAPLAFADLELETCLASASQVATEITVVSQQAQTQGYFF